MQIVMWRDSENASVEALARVMGREYGTYRLSIVNTVGYRSNIPSIILMTVALVGESRKVLISFFCSLIA